MTNPDTAERLREEDCTAEGEHGLCPCVTSHAREIMRYWTGTNCTWVDDDITALGILAGKAIRAGLHYGDELPDSLLAAIDEHVARAHQDQPTGEKP